MSGAILIQCRFCTDMISPTTCCDDIVTISSQGILYRHHSDVTTITRIFQKNSIFFAISILRRRDIAATCYDDIVMISSEVIFYRRHFDIVTMTRIFQKIQVFLQYRFCVDTTSSQRYHDDIFTKEYYIDINSMFK